MLYIYVSEFFQISTIFLNICNSEKNMIKKILIFVLYYQIWKKRN